MTILEKDEVGESLEQGAMRLPAEFEKGGYQGYKIFLDRYTLKADKGDVYPGDLVIIVTKRDAKFPQKELGNVSRIDDDGAWVELWTGGEHYEVFDLISKPIETMPQDVRERVAVALAESEDPSCRRKIEAEYRDILLNDFVPGGRILAGAGASELTLQNCFVIPNPPDSRGGIIESVGHMVETHSRGGGVGVNGSSLRPRFAHVKGVNGVSSGAVSWLKPYNLTTGLIEQGGSRRGATMLMMWDWHPDVLEFIEAKNQPGEFENTNMSVCISDDFMAAVKADGDWDLIFPETGFEAYDEEWDGNIFEWKAKGYPVVVYETIKARRIWDRLIESAWASAEPGLHFLELSNRMSNSWYFAPLVATNPCGEQPLEDWGVCTLGNVDLSRFESDGDVDWNRLGRVIATSVRFLDNVIDVNNYHLPQIKKAHEDSRRIGLGTMGLAELMIRLGIKYGSEEGIDFVENLQKFIAITAYSASSDLAVEKGSFGAFDADKFLQSGFTQNLPGWLRDKIRKQGIRNVCLLTQPPTGTTGTMVGTSTAGEPFYSWVTKRISRLGEHLEVPYVISDLGFDIDNLPDYCVNALELSPDGHLRMQAAMQKWIDSAISKTTNVPHEWTIEQVDELFLKAYDLGCKGVTIYRDGSRSEQVLTKASIEKEEPEETDWIKEGGCEISPDGTLSKCDL